MTAPFATGLRALAVSVLLLAGPAAVGAAAPEAQIKATYLFKFASFVRWPQPVPAGSPFTICVAGRGDVATIINALARDQQVGGNPISVVRLGSEAEQRAHGCQMLFLGRGAQTAISLRRATAGTPVLTITDQSSGTRGGVIEFMVSDGKVRFAINRSEASARQLELSSKLLDVAAEVE